MINELHIGLKGTMNALYLNDLADKTRRGLLAAAARGRIPTGKILGYDLKRQIDASGNMIKGLRQINEGEAALVRRIFREYANGRTLRQICDGLNAERIPSPRGKLWQESVLCGTRARQAGILRNTLYKGILTFNKQTYRKNPETGKRVARLNPSEKWIHTPVPELALMDAALFDEVQQALDHRSSSFLKTREKFALMTVEEKLVAKDRQDRKRQANASRESHKLYSGKLWCALHKRKLTVVARHRYGCPVRACANRQLKKPDLIRLILDGAGLSEEKVIAAYAAPDIVKIKIAEDAAIADLQKKQAVLREKITTILETLGHTGQMPTTREFLEAREREILRLQIDIEPHGERQALHSLPERSRDLLRHYRQYLITLHQDPDNDDLNRTLKHAFRRIDVFALWNDGDKTFEYACKVDVDILRLMDILVKKIA